MIEVRYAGAVVGRTAVVRELDTRGLFLGIAEPLPVGTPVILKIGDESVAGKVSAVAESQELARAGMRVRFADPASAALFGPPGEAAPEVEAPPSAKAPVAAVADAAPVSPASPTVTGPRRIVVDASSDHPVPEPSSTADLSTGADAGDAASAVGAGDGKPGEGKPGDGKAGDKAGDKKNRRNKRR
jgi:hypothetical protein